MKLLRQAQELQSKMAKAQAELETETVEGSAGGGAVMCVVTGAQRVLSVTIQPGTCEDTEMLQDLVLTALNDGLERSRKLAAAKLQGVAGGLGLPPGLI
jgi:nucleoid-associated protein EbfC